MKKPDKKKKSIKLSPKEQKIKELKKQVKKLQEEVLSLGYQVTSWKERFQGTEEGENESLRAQISEMEDRLKTDSTFEETEGYWDPLDPIFDWAPPSNK